MPQTLRRSDSFDLARERGILIPTSRSGSCMSAGHYNCSVHSRGGTGVPNMANNEMNTRRAAAPLAIIKFLELVNLDIFNFVEINIKRSKNSSVFQRVVPFYITTVSMTAI